jgi:5-methylcytosine-specific restriction enzyme A
MSRSVPEWVGKSDDSKIPDHVKLRIWEREGGICHLSGRKIRPGEAYDWEHKIALSLWTGEGHGNRESNIAPALRMVHREKTKQDRKAKAKSDQVKKKHLGIRKPSRMQSRGFNKAPPQKTASTPPTKIFRPTRKEA